MFIYLLNFWMKRQNHDFDQNYVTSTATSSSYTHGFPDARDWAYRKTKFQNSRPSSDLTFIVVSCYCCNKSQITVITQQLNTETWDHLLQLLLYLHSLQTDWVRSPCEQLSLSHRLTSAPAPRHTQCQWNCRAHTLSFNAAVTQQFYCDHTKIYRHTGITNTSRAWVKRNG